MMICPIIQCYIWNMNKMIYNRISILKVTPTSRRRRKKIIYKPFTTFYSLPTLHINIHITETWTQNFQKHPKVDENISITQVDIQYNTIQLRNVGHIWNGEEKKGGGTERGGEKKQEQYSAIHIRLHCIYTDSLHLSTVRLLLAVPNIIQHYDF